MNNLAIEQNKIQAINKLSNIIQKLDNKKQKDDVAYLIHRICELSNFIDSNIAREITHWNIQANKELFISL